MIRNEDPKCKHKQRRDDNNDKYSLRKKEVDREKKYSEESRYIRLSSTNRKNGDVKIRKKKYYKQDKDNTLYDQRKNSLEKEKHSVTSSQKNKNILKKKRYKERKRRLSISSSSSSSSSSNSSKSSRSSSSSNSSKSSRSSSSSNSSICSSKSSKSNDKTTKLKKTKKRKKSESTESSSISNGEKTECNRKEIREKNNSIEKKDPKENIKVLQKEVQVYNEHIYDSKEMIRLTISILQNYAYFNNFKILYKKLDQKKKISLESVKDKKLKKKLRHLFRAWKLEKVGEFYKKPSHFKESILEIFDGLLYYFLSKVDFQQLKENIKKRKELEKEKSRNNDDDPNDDEDEDRSKSNIINRNTYEKYTSNKEILDLIKNINTNNQSGNYEPSEEVLHLLNNLKEQTKSLRELHEEGTFKDSKQSYKEFLDKYKEVDLWGKSEQEQKYLLNTKRNPNERREFDRERDLLTTNYIKNEDYKKLIKNTKQHVNEKFHKTGYKP